MKKVDFLGCWMLKIALLLNRDKRNGQPMVFRLLTFFFLLVSGSGIGQIKTEIDRTQIKIGEPIHYKLTVLANSKDKIILPTVKDTLSFHVEVLEQKIDTVLNGEKKEFVQRLTLTSFDPGEFLIRSLPIVINLDTLLSNSFQIQVEDVEIDSANLQGFPIKPIMEEEYTWKDYWNQYWIYIVAGILVLLALLLIAILFLRDKKRKDQKSYVVKTPYEEAKDALKNLDKKKYLEKGQINPYYSELSYLLRKYLGRVYHFSSLELLSDDLVEHFKQTKELDETDTQKLKEFLFDSDLVKFAKAVPEEHLHAYYRKWVEDLVEKIKPIELEDDSVVEIQPHEKVRKIQ